MFAGIFLLGSIYCVFFLKKKKCSLHIVLSASLKYITIFSPNSLHMNIVRSSVILSQ